MKTIYIYSHFNYKKDNQITSKYKDQYDSRLEVYDNNMNLIFYTNNVNVDSSNKFEEKEELGNGEYIGITGVHRSKYKAILIFSKEYQEKVVQWKQLFNKYKKARYLPSKYPKGGNGANFINIHKGGSNYDWSAGCITIYWKDYHEFIKNFEFNEKVKIKKIDK